MTSVTAILPDELVAEIDAAARNLGSSRTDLIRRAVEDPLDDLEDVRIARQVLADPADVALDWLTVRSELVDPDPE